MLALALMKTAALVAGLSGLAMAALLQWNGVSAPAIAMHKVEMPNGAGLMVATHEVTRAQWQACVKAGACEAIYQGSNTSRDMPMTGVNHLDAEAFIAWIGKTSGLAYRLPSAAEWKVIAAELPKPAYAKRFTDPRMDWAANYGAMQRVSSVVKPSGTFGTYGNGISDLAGNVWEWTSTCTPGADVSRCPAFVAEGLHEAIVPLFVREPAAGGCATGAPPANVGFRLVRNE
jgi:formylglycine-generating enzyme required for sulfatase activity